MAKRTAKKVEVTKDITLKSNAAAIDVIASSLLGLAMGNGVDGAAKILQKIVARLDRESKRLLDGTAKAAKKVAREKIKAEKATAKAAKLAVQIAKLQADLAKLST
jgi:hypothetical protein